MNSLFSSWNGPVEIDGVNYKSVDEIPSDLNLDDNSIIVLHTVSKSSASQAPQASDKVYRVTVRQYMTKKSTPDFDFMLKMNNDIPMPLRTMVGTIISETPGMYKMHLKADTNFEYLDCCMKCGKHKVSCLCCCNSCGNSLIISHLTNHDDIRIFTKT